jgi:hypothetical protein
LEHEEVGDAIHTIRCLAMGYSRKYGTYKTTAIFPGTEPSKTKLNVLRRNYFANRVFESINAATAQTEFGLTEMAVNKATVKSLTNWPWINAILKA